MRKTLTILTLLAAIPAGAVMADDDCLVPMADWQPREAVSRLAADQGWEVRRIRIDDGCYEIEGRDVEGRTIEVKLHPGTLRIVEFEYEDDGEHRDDEDRVGEDREGEDRDHD